MKYLTLLIFVTLVCSTINQELCASNLSILVNRYKKLIDYPTPTERTRNRLTKIHKKLTPFIQEVVAWLEEDAEAQESDDSNSENEDTDKSDYDYNDLTDSNQDIHISLVQFIDDPSYFSPEEQADILGYLVNTYNRKCRLSDSTQ